MEVNSKIVVEVFNLESDYNLIRNDFLAYGVTTCDVKKKKKKKDDDEYDDEDDEDDEKPKAKYSSFEDKNMDEYIALLNRCNSVTQGVTFEIEEEELIYSSSYNIIRKVVKYRITQIQSYNQPSSKKF